MEHILAVHNLTERGLLDALELGGLPGPSIALIKRDSIFLDFGPLSLLVDPFKMDLSVNPGSRILQGDDFVYVCPPLIYKFDTRELANAVYHTYHVVMSGTAEMYLGAETGFDLARQAENFRNLMLPQGLVSFGEAKDFLSSHYACKRIVCTGNKRERKNFLQGTCSFTMENLLMQRLQRQKILQSRMSQTKKDDFFFPGWSSWHAQLCGDVPSLQAIDLGNLCRFEEASKKYIEAGIRYEELEEEICNAIGWSRRDTAKAGRALYGIRKLTPGAVRRAFEADGVSLREELVVRILSEGEFIKNLPVTYFTLRPGRAVSFSEIAAAVVPKKSLKKLEGPLRDRGVYVLPCASEKERPKLLVEAANRFPQVLIGKRTPAKRKNNKEVAAQISR